MHIIIKALVTMLISVVMHTGAINMISETPNDAAKDFMEAVNVPNSPMMEKYMDNTYVNFLCNIEGDDEVINRMREALFKNFSYEIVKVKQQGNVAAARVEIKTNDFSHVLDAYEKESYDYVMDNLYKDSTKDKEKLSAKCLEIYVDEIEECAEEGKLLETTVFVPMIDDGFYGWNIVMTDEFMKAIIGNLQIPSLNE